MAQISSRVFKRVLTRSTISHYRSLSSMDIQKPQYDVIIAGGGLVGVALAVSLGKFMKNLRLVYVF